LAKFVVVYCDQWVSGKGGTARAGYRENSAEGTGHRVAEEKREGARRERTAEDMERI
jgi:hypothetical protein